MKKSNLLSGNPLLHNRPYLSLMASQLVANMGDWLYLIALLTLIGFKWNATPWEITLTTLCMVLPMLVGGPLTGLLADRMERKKLMLLSDYARIVIMVLLIFAAALWQVYILLIAKGFFDILFSPAKNGKLKEIVPNGQLEQAVAVSAVIEQGSKMIGPAIGGALAGAFGETACFVVNACAFAVSALFLAKVPGKNAAPIGEGKEVEAKPAQAATGSFWSELGAGLRIITGIPVLAYGLVTLVAVLLALQIADSQVVVLFREIPDMPSDLLGYCIGLSGVGTLLATFALKLLRKWTTLAKMGAGGALLGAVFAGAGLLAFYGPFAAGNILFVVCFFLAGFGAGMTFLPFQITLQQETPVHQTGRVFGTVSSLTSTATLLGPLLGGLFVTSFGAAPAFLLSGGAVALFGFAVLLVSKRFVGRRMPSASGEQLQQQS
ncbi:MFS transporter [Paenibacillus thailandensis]|uniref:MFS transporter n=1 Tax=Paenibacillus thailandensis TaxID=393250 RepID=A0ABW5QXL7_9BACL